MASGTLYLNNSKSNAAGRHLEAKIEWNSVPNSATLTSELTLKLFLRQVPYYTAVEGIWEHSNPSVKDGELISVGDTPTVPLPTIQTKDHVAYSFGIVRDTWACISVRTVEIPHEVDGTKTIANVPYYVKAPMYTEYNDNPETGDGQFVCEGTLHFALDTIIPGEIIIPANASTVTATGYAYIGSEITAVIDNINTTYVHTVSYSLGENPTRTIIGAEYREDRTIKWTIPEEAYEEITEDKTGFVYIHVDTYTPDHVKVGDTQTAKITALTIEADCTPTINASIYDAGQDTVALTGNNKVIIIGYSDVRYAINASAKKHATVEMYTITNGSDYTVTEDAYGILYDVNSSAFNFAVYDSRGYFNEHVIVADKVDYIPLTCDIFMSPPLPDGTSTITISGNYYNGSFGAVDNTLELKWRYRIGETYIAWQTVTATCTDGRYTATVNLTGLDYRKSYIVGGYAKDKLVEITTSEESVVTLPVYDWGRNDMSINVDTVIHGKLDVDGVLKYQNNEDWCNGIFYCESDSTMSSSTKEVTCKAPITEIYTGMNIRVEFRYGNSNPDISLNINELGAKSIDFGWSDNNYLIGEGEVKDFVYDGYSWRMLTTSGDGTHGIYYCTCSVDKYDPEKIVECQTELDEMYNGMHIRVKFDYGFGVEPDQTVYIKFNNLETHELSIPYEFQKDEPFSLNDGIVKDFVFDGHSWSMLDLHAATTENYGMTRLTSTISDSEDYALTPKSVYDLGIETGTWTPELNSYYFSMHYSVQSGWYQKIGNIVTMGFTIVGTIFGDNYEDYDEPIMILGCPFYPAVPAHGGGTIGAFKISEDTGIYDKVEPTNIKYTSGWMFDTTGCIYALGYGEFMDDNKIMYTDTAKHLLIPKLPYDDVVYAGTITFMIN